MLLTGVNPKNVALMGAAATSIAGSTDDTAAILVLIAVTLILDATSALAGS